MSENNLRVDNLLSFLILSIQLSLKAIIFIAGLQTVLQKSLNYFKGTPFPQKNIPLPCLHPVPHTHAPLQQRSLSKIKTLFCV